MIDLKKFTMEISAIGIIIIGVIGIVGNLTTGRSLTHWGGSYGIAIPTCVAFILVGVNLMICSGRWKK